MTNSNKPIVKSIANFQGTPYVFNQPTTEQKLQLFGDFVLELTHGNLTLQHTLKDFSDYLYSKQTLEKYLKGKKDNAPDWGIALQHFLNRFIREQSPALGVSFDRVGFFLAVEGENPFLKDLADIFITESIPGVIYYDDKKTYISLAMGYSVGLKYPSLNNELKQIESSGVFKQIEVNSKQKKVKQKKIQVRCSPAQFSTILEMLMERGYLENNGNAEGTAKILLQAFSFENNPNVSYESLGKKFFKGVVIDIEDFEKISKGIIPPKNELKISRR